jgi:hypothetical protein
LAVGLILDFEGGTTDQYDQVVEKMELGGKVPEGAHFHWAAKTDDGFRVVDCWESQEAFDKFAEEKIGPLSAEVGLGEPKVTAYEVHNILD